MLVCQQVSGAFLPSSSCAKIASVHHHTRFLKTGSGFKLGSSYLQGKHFPTELSPLLHICLLLIFNSYSINNNGCLLQACHILIITMISRNLVVQVVGKHSYMHICSNSILCLDTTLLMIKKTHSKCSISAKYISLKATFLTF